MGESGSSEDEAEFVRVRGPADVQRLRLERLMANPDKPAHIPDSPKSKAPPPPAEYVRFYMGSSAGAGSGEFHIYRNLRRKEQNRMKYIDDEAKKDGLQQEFEATTEEKRRIADAKLARNRLKRQKRKVKAKSKRSKPDSSGATGEHSSSDSEGEDVILHQNKDTRDPTASTDRNSSPGVPSPPFSSGPFAELPKNQDT